MTSESRHLSEHVTRSAADVYEYVSNPANLAHWAPGLGGSVEQADGEWFVQTPAGRAGIRFAPRNEYGILDHYVSPPSGEVVYVPMRVIANRTGSEVLFTLLRQPGMPDEAFEADAAAVASDLARLKRILEQDAANGPG